MDRRGWKMSKTLCKSSKAKRKAEKCAVAESGATHVCRKCERFATSKKKLCKPVKILAAARPSDKNSLGPTLPGTFSPGIATTSSDLISLAPALCNPPSRPPRHRPE